MHIQDVANGLVDLLRKGQFEAIYDQYFEAEKVKHLEPQSPYFPELIGVDAIKEKDAAMAANIAAVEGPEVGNPIIAKDYFAVPYKMSVTLKDGKQIKLDEIIIYQVQDGKVILEQFFY